MSTNIKYPINTFLGSALVKAFPKTQYDKIKELIDAINGWISGTAPLSATSITLVKDVATISSTTATINKSSGVLTTPALSTAGGATSASYTITNSFVLANSTIQLTCQYANGKTGNPIAIVESVSAGNFVFKVGNGAPAATALNDVVKIHFTVL